MTDEITKKDTEEKEEGKTTEPELPIPTEILEKLPPEQRERFKSFMSMALSIGPTHNPILQKITSQHITAFIESQNKDTELEYSDKRHTRIYMFWAFIVACTLTTVVLIVLSAWNKADIAQEFIRSGLIGLGGSGIGYGFAQIQKRKEKD
jgi:hypothetical protein